MPDHDPLTVLALPGDQPAPVRLAAVQARVQRHIAATTARPTTARPERFRLPSLRRMPRRRLALIGCCLALPTASAGAAIATGIFNDPYKSPYEIRVISADGKVVYSRDCPAQPGTENHTGIRECDDPVSAIAAHDGERVEVYSDGHPVAGGS